MTKPGNSRTRHRIDTDAMRDKVDAPDPAAAPMDTDNEAAGTPTPVAVAEAADRQQMAAAQRAVPRLDRSREQSASAADEDLVGPRRRPETWRTPPR
jgi:hypothetical protein